MIDLPEPSVIPASGSDFFKNVSIDLGNSKDLWVEKVEVRPEQVAAVHHIFVTLRKKGDPPVETENGKLDVFAGFAPGLTQTIFPKGQAERLPAGYVLSASIHYTPIGRELVDHTQIALYFSKEQKAEGGFC